MTEKQGWFLLKSQWFSKWSSLATCRYLEVIHWMVLALTVFKIWPYLKRNFKKSNVYPSQCLRYRERGIRAWLRQYFMLVTLQLEVTTQYVQSMPNHKLHRHFNLVLKLKSKNRLSSKFFSSPQAHKSPDLNHMWQVPQKTKRLYIRSAPNDSTETLYQGSYPYLL